MPPKWPFIRDLLIFFGGLAGVLHEIFLAHGAERPELLILCAAMMGLPAFLPGYGGSNPKDRGSDGSKSKEDQEKRS